jgi:hypothetical protein
MDFIKMEDFSRVVKDILPKENNTMVQLRNYAYDDSIREMQKLRTVAPAGPRLNKFGRFVAGYVEKKSEKRDEIERKRKIKAAARSTTVQDEQPTIKKSDIEVQMDNEMTRHWIRKKNARIYDEKIKAMILTTDNGS